ncbi:MAG: Rpn family recombination-promoting nuclease/putative transposase [Candidatus Gastranaerophilales bacterium]|nr:Rpn family recombination-promoting nuclease/putative transposase [Candidatus Gastranaerophilales bacterium]
MSKNNTQLIQNTKLRDSSSKLIFDEPILCAQFLRDYIEDIPCLKSIQPEDIEDVSAQYVPLFSEERNSDRVKKIHVKDGIPFFLISLIEHKTKVEYNVAIQVFRYMIYIWDGFEKEEERRHPGISRQKDFRYPPILPIVYYEGKQTWTAPLDFKSRVMESDMFAKYIPDFSYYLVPLRSYSNQDLLQKADWISLVMLINRMQSPGDIDDFLSLPQDRLQTILADCPAHILNIIADILKAFLLKSNVAIDEAEEIVERVKEKDMGELFADMETFDLPAALEKARAEKRELEKRNLKLDQRQMQLDERKTQLDELENKITKQQQAMEMQIQQVNSKQEELLILQQKVTAQLKEIERLKNDLLNQQS